MTAESTIRQRRRPRTRPRQAVAVVTMAAAVLVVVVLSLRIRDHRPPSWDARLLRFLSPQTRGRVTASTLNGLADVVGEYQSLLLAGLLLAALLALRRGKAALMFGVVLGASLATVTILKPMFMRPSLIGDSQGYFPSSHAPGALSAGAAVVWAAWPTRLRWPALVTSVTLVVLYGAALVYTRSHYPSDVVAGWCVALAWCCGFVLLDGAGFRLRRGRRPP